MYQLKRLVGQVAGPSYARVPQSNNNGATSPLLPSFNLNKEGDDDDELPLPSNGSRSSRPRPYCRRILLPILFLLGLFSAVAAIAYFMRSPTPDPVDEPMPGPPPKVPPEAGESTPSTETDLTIDSVAAARLSIDALFARQSKTLAQASARYSLKTDRPPPPNFDKWFNFTREKKCLIDDYEQVYRDFEPFYQLAAENPNHFRDMIDRGRAMMLQDSKGMTTINIKDHKVHMPDYRGTSFYDDWPRTINRFVSVLPDMDFLLNGRDEPRVVFNYRDPDARKDAMVLKDPNPFTLEPRPTSDFFKNQSGCSPLGNSKGFGSDGSDDIAFLRSSSSSDFTTDLWPLLSMTKISPCFSDIVFPGQYYYDESWWSGSFSHPNNIKWENKEAKLYWRGMSNGGHILGDNYHKFPRFRLVDIARNHTDLIDAKMTRFAEGHCTDPNDCDREHIIEEYDITGPAVAQGGGLQVQVPARRRWEHVLRGVHGLRRVLQRLAPPVRALQSPCSQIYRTMVEKVQWAIAHESEARIIQETGKLFTERVMTDSQNDCYFAMVLLEWARLQNPTEHA
ncbi:hypothetical protein DFH06DRAFT_1136330 [Mycena polygramma]|nr:hypothetical protein DFH06DRAFT_1136330 [Mycena polygramma]